MSARKAASARKRRHKPMMPFRAWCPVLADGGVPVSAGCVAVYVSRGTCEIECDLNGGRPVRVRVVPIKWLRLRKPTAQELARTHRAAVRVAARVLRRDGWGLITPDDMTPADIPGVPALPDPLPPVPPRAKSRARRRGHS